MRIGIIGAALSHPLNFTMMLQEFNLASEIGMWAPDSDQDNVAKFSKKAKFSICDSPEQLIDSCDAVIVTTTTNLHKQYALKALEKGKPVFVDKPLATCFADAVEVVDKALSVNVPVMSCSVRRFTPAFDTIASAVRGNEIGKPISAAAFGPHGIVPGDWQDRLETSGGYIFNFGIHCIDILQKVLGPKAEEVSCYAGKFLHQDADTHDVAIVTIRFSNGSVGTAELIGCMNPNDKLATAPSLKVYCMDNTLEARLDENFAYQYVGGRFGVSPYYRINDGTLDTMKAFVEMVRTGEPAIPYDEMLEVIKILDAARKSDEENRPVQLSQI